MISRITGILDALDPETGKAYLAMPDGLVYELLIPAYVTVRLAPQVGTSITLHTLHYLEGSSQGSNFTPRLAGFLAASDKAFFELFTTVKGIGPRKALRAMSLPPETLANAISDRDAKLLQSLPEIGKRTAETVIVTLHGKLDRFLNSTSSSTSRGTDQAQPATSTGANALARETIEVLTQLGENRTDAIRWVDTILARHPEIEDSQRLLAEVFRIKG